MNSYLKLVFLWQLKLSVIQSQIQKIENPAVKDANNYIALILRVTLET